MTALLDVNVLVALSWSSHVHHAPVRSWFNEHSVDGWATCPLTESGFVRVFSNPATTLRNVTALDALVVLEHLTRMGSHTFWPMDWSILDIPRTIAGRIQGYRQVSDAILLTTALRHGGQLVTLDRALPQLLESGQSDAVSLIPV